MPLGENFPLSYFMNFETCLSLLYYLFKESVGDLFDV